MKVATLKMELEAGMTHLAGLLAQDSTGNACQIVATKQALNMQKIGFQTVKMLVEHK